MKRTIITIIAAAVAMAAVSCNKEISNPQAPRGETLDISVSALMPEYSEGVKSELVNTMRVSWKNGDVIYVYDGTQYLGSLVASLNGDEDRYALLSTDDSHTVKEPAAGTDVLTLVYSPLLTKAPSVAGNSISVSLAAQNTPKAPFVAFATLDYTGTTIKNAVVPFKFATSVIKVNCTGLKPGTAITFATLSNVNTECKLTLSGTAAPSVSGGTNGTITRTGDEYFAATKVNDEGEAVFQIAVPKLETASGARVLTITQGTDIFKDVKFSTKSIGSATSVNTVCQLFALPEGALPGVFTVSNYGKKVFFSKGNLYAKNEGTTESPDWKWHFYDEQYKYNSIATSSGSRTAADTDTEIDLFTWGYNATYSVKPTGSDFVGGHDTEGNKQLKHSTDGDDWGVAYCNLNNIAVGTWRTLSTAEWQYLFNGRDNASNLYKGGVTVCGKTNCVVLLHDNWEWDETADEHNVGTGWQDGGYPETQTGNEVTWERMEKAGAVCLPAAGYRSGSIVYNVGDNGYYWSATANDEYGAFSVYFFSYYVSPSSSDYRGSGCSVRLITESK